MNRVCGFTTLSKICNMGSRWLLGAIGMQRDHRQSRIEHSIARLAGFLLVVAFAPATQAHHSITGTFDATRFVEIEGEITRVLWRNPHIRLTVRTEEQGQAAEWTIESGAVSRLSRWGVENGTLSVGDTIRLAGFPSKRRANEMYGQNILLADGREILMDHRASSRWNDQAIGGERMSVGASDSTLGIFRVWTSDGQSYDADIDSFPLTAAARAAHDAWNIVEDNPLYGCMPKGMPTIMEQPFPIELIDRGDEIHMRIEEYDLLRLFYMSGAPSPSVPPSILGDSTGRWDGDTLVVTTTNIGWPYSFGQFGIPQSEAVELVERFTVTDDGRLNYQITATDPATYTEPLTLSKPYVWVPGLEILPYECTDG
jgi:hypothetical protein